MGSSPTVEPEGSASATAPKESAAQLIALGAPVALRDGSRARIRQWQPSDRELLVSGFRRLSPTSSYRRCLSASPVLSRQTVRQQSAVNYRDAEALLAFSERGNEGLGIASYVRSPARPDVAEVTVTTIDDWQGRGLGTLLLEVISARARQEQIRTFTALTLSKNRRMRDLLERLGPLRIVDEARGTVEVEVPLPAVEVAPALRQLLRIASQHRAGSPDTLGNAAPNPSARSRSEGSA